MGQMASALAHELNQPLSAIASYMKGSRRLLGTSGEDRSDLLRDAMDKAADQALRAGQIIRRLREFVARGDSERRVESVKKLIEEASALALVGTKDQGVRVRFQFDPAVDLVLVDKVQIQQVLLNLMRNAVEAMEASRTARARSSRRRPTRTTWSLSAWRIPDRVSHRKSVSDCSSPSSPPSVTAWASACRSVAPLSRPMAVGSVGAQSRRRNDLSLHPAGCAGGVQRCSLTSPSST